MHRSRLSTLLIDAPAGEADASAAFWAGALGVATSHPAGGPQFTTLHGAVAGMVTAVQTLDDGAARYHVDLETDDVAAECTRLEALGAIEVSTWLDCHTFRVPGGHLLCVIPLHSDLDAFAAAAHTWI